MHTNRRTAAALVSVAMIGLVGCGSSSETPRAEQPSKTPKATETTKSNDSGSSSKSTDMSSMATITIQDFVYDGAKTLGPDEMVHVTNADETGHTVTSDAKGAFDVTVDADGKGTFTSPTKPGKYPYHCTFHADMTGTLVVK